MEPKDYGPVLGLARQSSHDRKAPTVTRQAAEIREACAEEDVPLVTVVQDRHVSGKFSPFNVDKRGSGPWLTDAAKIAQWQAIRVFFAASGRFPSTAAAIRGVTWGGAGKGAGSTGCSRLSIVCLCERQNRRRLLPSG
jgi:hypothetical protein